MSDDDTVWSRVQGQPEIPWLTNHAALIWSEAKPNHGAFGPLREHGLSEAELMTAYSHLIPEEQDDAKA
tara:strand:+ start:969 stop:1175 length:207 start_codon:yes stop_codon:yes gene_type:complete